MIEEFTPTSYEELERLLDPYRGSYSTPGARLVYRGCGCDTWSLETTLLRLNGDVATKETHIIEQFIRNYPDDGGDMQSQLEAACQLEVLAHAQHNGAPTRLLDWTYDSVTALHFATSNVAHIGVAGAIWVAEPALVHTTLPTGVRSALGLDVDDRLPVSEVVQKSFQKPADIDAWSIPSSGYVPCVFFESSRRPARARVQASVFSMAGNPAVDVAAVLEVVVGACRKIILSTVLKAEARERLDRAERDERAFYPDTVGLVEYLRRVHGE